MKSDQLQKWALIAEICGGVGVIVTLILLILETQENTQVMRAATYDAIQADIADWRLLGISDDEILEVNFKTSTEGRGDLSPIEDFIDSRRSVAVFQHYERAFIQWQLGNLSDEAWERFRTFLCEPTGHPGFESRIGELLDRVTTAEFTYYRKNEC